MNDSARFLPRSHNPNVWNGEVKVITGIHRCGKSVLLFDLFYEHLLAMGTPEDCIIKIELDQRRYYDDNGIIHCNLIDLLLGRVELF